jgi:hypothetical protein
MWPRNSVATAMHEWHRARPDLDLGPLGLFATLAHVYWLTAPEIERLMASHGITRGMFDLLTTVRRAGPPYTLAPKQLSQSLLLSGLVLQIDSTSLKLSNSFGVCPSRSIVVV